MKDCLYSRGYAMLGRGMSLTEIADALGFHDVEALLLGTRLRGDSEQARIEQALEIVNAGDADADETAFGFRIGTWFRSYPAYVNVRRM